VIQTAAAFLSLSIKQRESACPSFGIVEHLQSWPGVQFNFGLCRIWQSYLWQVRDAFCKNSSVSLLTGDIVLQCTPFIPEARAVLDLVDQCPKHIQKGKFPVIAIEGLDATGKTT
jgi:hypothetical protein